NGLRLVAVHQPTFLPWLGWWDELLRADIFVLLDDVQYPKKGGTWMNRVRLLVDGRPAWVTVPLDRSYHGVRSVREMRVDEAKPWRDRIEATIATAYANAPHVAQIHEVVANALRTPTNRMAEISESAIRLLAAGLDVDASKIVHQSKLGVDGSGTRLLVSLCSAVHGDAYLSGDGAGDYLEEERFAEAGLKLLYQNFVPPTYPQ